MMLVAQMAKNLPAMWETCVQSQGQEDPLEEGMANQSSILAWRMPWTEEPGGLQSQTVRHDWVTKQQQQTLINQYLDQRWGFPGDSVVKNSFANGGDKGSILGSGRSPGEENSNPLQYTFLGNPMESRDWRATVHGVAKESTKQLNSNRSGVGWLWSTG